MIRADDEAEMLPDCLRQASKYEETTKRSGTTNWSMQFARGLGGLGFSGKEKGKEKTLLQGYISIPSLDGEMKDAQGRRCVNNKHENRWHWAVKTD